MVTVMDCNGTAQKRTKPEIHLFVLNSSLLFISKQYPLSRPVGLLKIASTFTEKCL